MIFGRISIAAVTPFVPATGRGFQAVDQACLQRTIEHIARGMAAAMATVAVSQRHLIGGIIIPGTTGEQHSLTVSERKAVYAVAVAAAAPFDVPVFAGVASSNTYEAVDLATQAAAAGCAGLMLGLPPYIRPGNEEVTSYVEAVYDAVPRECPILLYNNVLRNGNGPSMECLASLFKRNLICGIKHASLEMIADANKLLALEPLIKLYTGSDVLSAKVINPVETEAECDRPPEFFGLTSIVGNLYPEEIVKMIVGLVGTDSEKNAARVLHSKLSVVANACLTNCSVPVGLKYAMRQQKSRYVSNDIGGWPRLPLGFLSAEKEHEIDQALYNFEA